MRERFKNITTWLATSGIKVLGILIALLVRSKMPKSGMIEAVSLRRLLKKSFSAGCSKMPRRKAPEILRVASRRIRSDILPRRRVGESAEAYLDVRCNDLPC